ncbi:MAG: Holliday junction resolvase RuvX [Candidatus Moraniibacteriota bacterium]|nr:MAG: Holliday junction resolvase RuvX [Candidatus Moranbacteria bacterium]
MEIFSYLGIDWGEKKVGVAIADSETKMAFSLVTLPNDDRLIDALGSILEERSVREVVIGIPSHVNRERVEYGGEKLGKQLAERFGVSIRYENEMFTTKMARAELIERGVRGHLDAQDDREAARIILESFLAGKGEL